jgi:hypothetical protein
MHQKKVTMRTYLTSLLLILCASCGSDSTDSTDSTDSSDIALSFGVLEWVFPSQREDGSSLLLSDISSFRVYYGNQTEDYLGDVQVDYPNSSLELLKTNFTSGTYYFAVTTVDTAGRESLYSDEVVLTF